MSESIKKYKSIWISDTHLGTWGAKAPYLSDFLKQNDCENLFLLGDIIDGWRMKKKAYWPQEHTNVIRRILTRSKRGTKVVWVAGNHDEFLRNYLEYDLQFGNIDVKDEYYYTSISGLKIWMVHGDYFDQITRYHKWVAILGDHAYTLLLLSNTLLNKIRQRFGFGYWSLSQYLKQKAKTAVSFIADFEESLSHECKKNGYDAVICGHIHKAEIKNINDVFYMNDGDWCESCTAIAEDYDGNFNLIQWGDGKSPKVIQILTYDHKIKNLEDGYSSVQ